MSDFPAEIEQTEPDIETQQAALGGAPPPKEITGNQDAAAVVEKAGAVASKKAKTNEEQLAVVKNADPDGDLTEPDIPLADASSSEAPEPVVPESGQDKQPPETEESSQEKPEQLSPAAKKLVETMDKIFKDLTPKSRAALRDVVKNMPEGQVRAAQGAFDNLNAEEKQMVADILLRTDILSKLSPEGLKAYIQSAVEANPRKKQKLMESLSEADKKVLKDTAATVIDDPREVEVLTKLNDEYNRLLQEQGTNSPEQLKPKSKADKLQDRAQELLRSEDPKDQLKGAILAIGAAIGKLMEFLRELQGEFDLEPEDTEKTGAKTKEEQEMLEDVEEAESATKKARENAASTSKEKQGRLKGEMDEHSMSVSELIEYKRSPEGNKEQIAKHDQLTEDMNGKRKDALTRRNSAKDQLKGFEAAAAVPDLPEDKQRDLQQQIEQKKQQVNHEQEDIDFYQEKIRVLQEQQEDMDAFLEGDIKELESMREEFSSQKQEFETKMQNVKQLLGEGVELPVEVSIDTEHLSAEIKINDMMQLASVLRMEEDTMRSQFDISGKDTISVGDGDAKRFFDEVMKIAA